MDGLHYAKAGNRTIRSVCPHTSYQYDTPTCNAYSHRFGFLLRPEPESHLLEAHDNHRASDADNHKRLRAILAFWLGCIFIGIFIERSNCLRFVEKIDATIYFYQADLIFSIQFLRRFAKTVIVQYRDLFQ